MKANLLNRILGYAFPSPIVNVAVVLGLVYTSLALWWCVNPVCHWNLPSWLDAAVNQYPFVPRLMLAGCYPGYIALALTDALRLPEGLVIGLVYAAQGFAYWLMGLTLNLVVRLIQRIGKKPVTAPASIIKPQ